MARDIYDMMSIFCCYFPFFFVLASLLNILPVPDWVFIVTLIVSVCVFNGVWGTVKPRIVKKKNKNQNFGANYPPTYNFSPGPQNSNNFSTNPQNVNDFSHPTICPGCGSIVPEGSVFCPNCGNTM